MTIEELRALVQAANESSAVAWDAARVLEETNGLLKKLNDNAANTLSAYSIALEQLQKQIPDIDGARLMLSGAKSLEAHRGGAQPSLDALAALGVYEAAPFHGESFGSSWATAVNVST